jgi:hypothetical protein
MPSTRGTGGAAQTTPYVVVCRSFFSSPSDSSSQPASGRVGGRVARGAAFLSHVH